MRSAPSVERRATGMRAWLASAAALSAAACVTSPKSNTSVTGTEIEFQGVYSHTTSSTLTIQGRRGRRWVDLGRASVGADDRWSTRVSVPSNLWPGLCEPATFRVTDSSGTVVPGLDQTCLDAFGPSPTLSEMSSCSVNQLVITRPTEFTGDLTIGPSDAADYQCITRVNGNLTILGGQIPDGPAFQTGLMVSLPNLTEVSGDLTLQSDHAEALTFDGLTSVGGTLSVTMNRFNGVSYPGGVETHATVITSISAPALTHVGQDVLLRATKDSGVGGSSAFYNFGLAALTSVGGSVLSEILQLPGSMTALQNLLTVPGNVTFNWPLPDVNASSTLTNLTHIGGNLQTTTSPNFNSLLPALTEVEGSVSMFRAGSTSHLKPGVLPQLAVVGGDVTLTGMSLDTYSLLVALTEVGGTFRILNGGTNSRFGVASGPALGGIEITGSTGSKIPFGNSTTVAGSGPVSIHDNEFICPCQVDAFAATLTTNGWGGTAVNTGNGASAACGGACPSSTCP
jgi:hypothetical protein